jgi:hypothetical protein
MSIGYVGMLSIASLSQKYVSLLNEFTFDVT